MMGLAGEGSPSCQQFSSVSVNGSDTVIYYGIWYPKSCFSSETTELETLPLVLTDYKEVTAVLKKCKGCRFKGFKTREEALAFAKTSSEQIMSPYPSSTGLKKTNGNDIEKGSTFQSLKTQDYAKLRGAIETGDVDCFRQTVWSNPRYLIGNADNPTIFHEGGRFNALHVVAKSNQPAMCRLILQIIEDPKFMQLMYNDDKPSDNIRRTKYLVDLYLNMRDKGLNETPLHVAAKFGAVDVVAALAGHPACDKYPKNKYGETPQEVALSRCSATPELKRAMAEAFEDKYFVAVMVNNDGSAPPYVSEPLSPVKTKQTIEEIIIEKKNAPLIGSPEIRACAGPMSEDQAKKFQEFLKSPNNFSPRSLRSIKLSDMEKGLERIGRCKASEMQVEWREKWEFLNCYCNICSSSGLKKLEDYLKLKWDELHPKPESVFYDSIEDSPGTHLCRQFERLTIASTSPESVNCSTFWQHNYLENSESADRTFHINENDYSDRMSKDISRLFIRELHEQFENGVGLKSDFATELRGHFECLRLNVDDSVNKKLSDVHMTIAELMGAVLRSEINDFKMDVIRAVAENPAIGAVDKDESYCTQTQSPDVYQHICCILKLLHSILKRKRPSECECSWEGEKEDIYSEEDTYFTPPSSLINSRSSSPMNEEYLSPDEGPTVFINGLLPSKLDLDVWRALGDTKIDSLIYPHISKWKSLVSSHSKEETERWRTPMKRPIATQISSTPMPKVSLKDIL